MSYPSCSLLAIADSALLAGDARLRTGSCFAVIGAKNFNSCLTWWSLHVVDEVDRQQKGALQLLWCTSRPAQRAFLGLVGRWGKVGLGINAGGLRGRLTLLPLASCHTSPPAALAQDDQLR